MPPLFQRLLESGGDLHARNDEALRSAAGNGHTETEAVKTAEAP